MCTVVDLPTSSLASLFAAVMFTGIHNQFPLLTTVGPLLSGHLLGGHSPSTATSIKQPRPPFCYCKVIIYCFSFLPLLSSQKIILFKRNSDRKTIISTRSLQRPCTSPINPRSLAQSHGYQDLACPTEPNFLPSYYTECMAITRRNLYFKFVKSCYSVSPKNHQWIA